MKQDNPSKKGRWWPWMLVVLLASGSGFNLFMVSVALSDPSFAVEKNYYQKALRWDQTMAQQRENTRLGWSIQLKAAPVPTQPKAAIQLTAQVLDRQGRVVKGARLSLEAFHNARSRQRFHKEMSRHNNTYQATLPTYRKGVWIFQYTVRRGQHHFTQTLRREL